MILPQRFLQWLRINIWTRGARYTPKTVREWAKHWDAKAHIEDPIALNGYCVGGKPIPWDLYREAVIVPYVERLEVAPHHAVLEVGCGSGEVLREIEPRVRWCVGADMSRNMLRRARGRVALVCCDADALPFATPSFDRILMASVAHYFPSFHYFEGVVRRLVALLRTDGILLIGDMTYAPSRQFTTYDRHEMLTLLDDLGYPYSIMAQTRPKRRINRRYDVLVFKEAR